jgi:hypothetical protein
MARDGKGSSGVEAEGVKRERRSDSRGYIYELLAKGGGWAMIRRIGGYPPRAHCLPLSAWKTWDRA